MVGGGGSQQAKSLGFRSWLGHWYHVLLDEVRL